MLIPPSTINSLPTVNAASFDARKKRIAFAISAGFRNLRAGICWVESRAALLFFGHAKLVVDGRVDQARTQSVSCLPVRG